MKEPTPVMKQYLDVKERYPDAIVMFRLGDFYEMFGDDARNAAKILSITLTSRDKNKEDPIPMCGFPFHAIDGYVKKLIDAGRKVAVCEQMEDPATAKGIVLREVVRVITPGTYEPQNPKENSYIMSVFPAPSGHGIALSDISTGDLLIFETDKPLFDEIYRFNPGEILSPDSLKDDIHYKESFKGYFVTYYDRFFFDYTEAYRNLLGYFKVATLEGYGCEGFYSAISAAGGLVSYLQDTQKSHLTLKGIRPLDVKDHMFLDSPAIRNLELFNNLKDGTKEETLLSTLDYTMTPMGGRMLRDAMARPLINVLAITRRHDAVQRLYEDFRLLDTVKAGLKEVSDVERLCAALMRGSANARDLIAIKNSITGAGRIREAISSNIGDGLLNELAAQIGDHTEIFDTIVESIIDPPPHSVKEGGIIKDGFNVEVDELREINTKGKDYLIALEEKLRKSTGINSLKVGFNKVFGYYIEVTKANIHLVPDNFIRKQTLTTGERFITEELKDYENKILGAVERQKALEYHLFRELGDWLKTHVPSLRATAFAIGAIDMLCSLAEAAKRNTYVKPDVDDYGNIEIISGRHPVIELIVTDGRFIPNDTMMDMTDNRLFIITGPNMAGKSTFMRQTALIVLMAQMGSFVPADKARIGLVDRIFTRIGASDYLSRGQSTFMVEMIETANIVNNATEKSLIVLDEVGRGTSTFDGISIAWAAAEYIAMKLRTRTLFATHYNELTEMANGMQSVVNYNITVREWGDQVIFLHKIARGSADKSYGIQVGRLAGLPDSVIERAREILNSLEKEEIGEAKVTVHKRRGKASQLDLFSNMENPIIMELSSIDTNNISEADAVSILKRLKKIAIGR